MDDREFTLFEHLGELRTRVVRAAIGVVLVSLVAFAAAEQIIWVLRLPLEEALKDVSGGQAKFVVIAPAEYFLSQLKASLVAGVFIASPWALYQLWMFIAPGLYVHERRWVVGFVVAGAFFFCAGGAFAYFFAFPGMFRFFLEATIAANIDMTLSIAEHLSFSMKLLLAFGVAFQTPVIVFVLSMAGIVNPTTLSNYRSYVVVGAFVIGAILTPPDILSQTLLSIPLVLLFELGILVSRIVLKFKSAPLTKDARKDARARVDEASAASSSPPSSSAAAAEASAASSSPPSSPPSSSAAASDATSSDTASTSAAESETEK